jgi:hypothetical protein
MQTFTRILGALAVTAAVVGMPGDLTAQVPASQVIPTAPAAPPCTAEVLPAEIAAGTNAVRLTVALSADVGEVGSMEAAEASGVAVAAPNDLPRIPLATEAPQPIAAGEGDNTWTVWVNTSDADPGTHEVTFVGPEGRCTADLTVTAAN